MQHQRNRTNCFYIYRHIVATYTITTSNRTNQSSIFIGKRNAQSVILHFTAHLKRFTTKSLFHAFIPTPHLIFTISIRKRKHWITMFYLTKSLIQITTNAHGRRVRIGQFRMTHLQILQLTHHDVKFLITNDRLIQHIITIIMLMQYLS